MIQQRVLPPEFAEFVLEGDEIAADGDDRQLLGDAGKDGRIVGIEDPLRPVAVAKCFAHMPDFGVVAAADQLEQDRIWARVRQFQRIEVVKRREFLVAAD